MQDDKDFIKGCINSCTNMFHIKCCNKLIELFKTKHGSETSEIESELLEELIQKRQLIYIAV